MHDMPKLLNIISNVFRAQAHFSTT